MENYKLNRFSVYITVLWIVVNLKCYSARSVFSVENDDYYSIFNNYQKDIRERAVQVTNNKSYTFPPYSTNEPPIVKVSSVPLETTLWPSGTMTRKHFEIINMLWRKTKIFFDSTDFTIPSWYHNNFTTKLFRITDKTKPIFSTRPPAVSTTTSKIEFYYLNDENIVRDTDEKCNFGSKCIHSRIIPQNMGKSKSSNSSFLVFHIRAPLINTNTKGKSMPTKRFYNDVFLDKSVTQSYSTFLVPKIISPTSFKIIDSRKKSFKNYTIPSVTYSTTNRRLALYRLSTYADVLNKTQNKITKRHETNYRTFDFFKRTTVYDKIKFFEMYDRMTPITPPPWNVDQHNENYEEDTQESDNKIKKDQEKISLLNVDQSSHEHNQSKPAKKHIRNDQQYNTLSTETTHTKERLWKNKIVELKTETKAPTTQTTSIESKTEGYNKMIGAFSFTNKTVEWSEYPFAAVYVYEPSQIRCDAVGISPHWLIAAGACLSRLNKNPNGEGRSAFVAYCGVEWWKPERISYVKYSLVHPWFHPREKPRKYQYNIGLVKVVTSMMSACSGWSPVTLMSHQFATSREGMVASAVGWGLDRIDSRYAPHLPRNPLTVYNALLFSDSCPGMLESSEENTFVHGFINKNVYCLGLPPYFGEDTDPVHGGLLLVGSHLIALYLQEERRPWGEQSAQYTGIWRLIPWITEVAKETEDIETSFIEI